MAITTGTLTLLSTMECISVKCSFTGTAVGTLSATIQYKLSSASTWIDAYPPIVDLRTTIDGNANPYVNQARGSIVGLTTAIYPEASSFDVRITFSDSGGSVGGTNPKTGSISTLSWTPPTGGSTFYVAKDTGVDSGPGSSGSPWATIDYAIAHTSAGDTIKVRDSATPYPQLTITASGTSSAFRKLINDTGATPVIGAGGAYAVIQVDADYWWIRGFAFEPTSNTKNGLYVSITHHDIYAENLTCSDFGLGAPADGNYWAFFQLGYPASVAEQVYNIFCRNNSATCTRNCSIPNNLAVDFGFLSFAQTVVFANNTITGGGGVGNWWDCFGNGTNSYIQSLENVDFCNNTFDQYNDDSIELDGAGVNVRAWSNTMLSSSTLGYSAAGISMQPVLTGPCYVFRNLVIIDAANCAGAVKSASAAGMVVSFVFHNTFDISGSAGGGHPIFDEGMGIRGRNNIGYTHGNAYQVFGGVSFDISDCDQDYNCMWMPGSDYTDHWGVTIGLFRSNTATAGYPQDVSSKNEDPLLSGAPSDTITSSSPAYNTGAFLANFNSRDSIWGYQGTAPDMGYYEVGGFYPPTPPTPPAIITDFRVWSVFDV